VTTAVESAITEPESGGKRKAAVLEDAGDEEAASVEGDGDAPDRIKTRGRPARTRNKPRNYSEVDPAAKVPAGKRARKA